jgi:hypothetical protein
MRLRCQTSTSGSPLQVVPNGSGPFVCIGEDEPIAVEQHAASEPCRGGASTDEAEQTRTRNVLPAAGRPGFERLWPRTEASEDNNANCGLLLV